ncbi:hypothetical protein ACFWNZ_12420, partial [Streptomyces rubiginosohelvolus]|uniref:hypothetical protein n=1 Tax=Streptomyces rubiginosohelvolus TaxID=67362 RepID=UPI0036549F25
VQPYQHLRALHPAPEAARRVHCDDRPQLTPPRVRSAGRGAAVLPAAPVGEGSRRRGPAAYRCST